MDARFERRTGMAAPVLMGMLAFVLVSDVGRSGRSNMDARFERRIGMMTRERARRRIVQPCQRFGLPQG
jgi:hypothetical protein